METTDRHVRTTKYDNRDELPCGWEREDGSFAGDMKMFDCVILAMGSMPLIGFSACIGTMMAVRSIDWTFDGLPHQATRTAHVTFVIQLLYLSVAMVVSG